MKVKVIGIERMEGDSKKTGKPYAMAKLHTTLPLEFRKVDDGNSHALSLGEMGTVYEDVKPDVIRTIEELPLPFLAELEIQDVMRFGKRQSNIVGIKPISSRPAPAVPPVPAVPRTLTPAA